MEAPHALVADTDALIALATTSLWSSVSQNVGISTTNACLTELKDLAREWNGTGLPGGERARHGKAADRVIEAVKNDSAIKQHVIKGCRNGEHSVMKLVRSNPDYVEGILMMDSGEHDEYTLGGRKLIREHINLDTHNIVFPSPAFPLAILVDNGIISREQFCEQTQDIMVREDWTSYSAIKRMWDEIPVDCKGYVDKRYLHEKNP